MTRVKFLERHEIERMVKTAPEGTLERALMEVLWSTGARISEVLSLPAAPILAMPVDETGQYAIIGKMGIQGLIFFTPGCIAAVRRYTDGTEASESSRLFPITPRTAQRIVKRAAEAAGIPGKVTPHTFRHSLATYMLRESGNLRIVQELLRHRSITSTQRYAGVANKYLLEAHKKFV